jgi:signal transduction histidine kinase
MSRALLNLVKNSIEAMPEGGRVVIATRTDGESVELSVADDGPGVDAEARGRLFQPYWTTKTSGTGLGLAIVHRIVSEHGGRIDLDRSAEQGTRFVLTLPVRHQVHAQPAAPAD